MKNINLFVVLVVIMIGASSMISSAKEGNMSPKPQPPLLISIAPAQPGVTPETIKAGDLVDFKVVASSIIDTTEMRIQIELADGAELVSGDLSWAGPAGKKEEKQLFFSVRVPATGTGKISARLTVSTGGAKPLSRSAQYYFLTGEQKEEQTEALKERKSTNPARKDSKGKEVIEYR